MFFSAPFFPIPKNLRKNFSLPPCCPPSAAPVPRSPQYPAVEPQGQVVDLSELSFISSAHPKKKHGWLKWFWVGTLFVWLGGWNFGLKLNFVLLVWWNLGLGGGWFFVVLFAKHRKKIFPGKNRFRNPGCFAGKRWICFQKQNGETQKKMILENHRLQRCLILRHPFTRWAAKSSYK